MKLSFKIGAASLIKYKASQSFFVSEGEKINQIHFCRGRVPRQKYFSRSECRACEARTERKPFCQRTKGSLTKYEKPGSDDPGFPQSVKEVSPSYELFGIMGKKRTGGEKNGTVATG